MKIPRKNIVAFGLMALVINPFKKAGFADGVFLSFTDWVNISFLSACDFLILLFIKIKPR